MRDLLQKLMFWKKDTVELDYEVSGCFTLPESEGAEQRVADEMADGVTEATADPAQ